MLESGHILDLDGSLNIGIREAQLVEKSLLQSNDDAFLIIENITKMMNDRDTTIRRKRNDN